MLPVRALTCSVAGAGAAIALAAGAGGVAFAQPVQVFQQPAEAVGSVAVPAPLPLSIPTLATYELRAEQAGPGAVRLWVNGSDQPCSSPANRVTVLWGNFETGITGAQPLAACAQSDAPRDAVVTTGAGGVNFQLINGGPAQLELGSSGSVGDPALPYLNGNGAFTVH